jgi:hypothetical protein
MLYCFIMCWIKIKFSYLSFFLCVNRYDIICILIAGSYKIKFFFPFFPSSMFSTSTLLFVRDFSAVRRLVVRLAVAVGCQSALHKENSRIAAPTALYHVCCGLRMQIIWHAALNSSHHAMCCCHHSVSIARSRLMAESFLEVTWQMVEK